MCNGEQQYFRNMGQSQFSNMDKKRRQAYQSTLVEPFGRQDTGLLSTAYQEQINIASTQITRKIHEQMNVCRDIIPTGDNTTDIYKIQTSHKQKAITAVQESSVVDEVFAHALCNVIRGTNARTNYDICTEIRNKKHCLQEIWDKMDLDK
jgi:hypothetical protein